jgi:uncharacterized OB-fold protein
MPSPAPVAPIELFACRYCTRVWYFERRYCPSCGADRPTARPSAGTGTVRAATTVHRSSERHGPLRHIVLVDLDDGVRVMGASACRWEIGTRVRGALRPVGPASLPYFEKVVL